MYKERNRLGKRADGKESGSMLKFILLLLVAHFFYVEEYIGIDWQARYVLQDAQAIASLLTDYFSNTSLA